MKVILNAGFLPERYKKVVAAIGVFDGLHLGHQRVIARAVDAAKNIRGTSVVVTFFPHPVAILHPREFNGYVVSLEHRIRLIKALGVDVCYVIPFSRPFARRSADDFARNFLIKRLRADRIVVGEDFHFGNRRQGSADLFNSLGVAVETVPLLRLNNISVKTRFLKKLVAEGGLGQLKAFLNRDHGVFAEVVHGKGFGRRLGFPTANLEQENVITLPPGIYVVRVCAGIKKYCGVSYIGSRPAFNRRPGAFALEVHILDYRGNLYGKKITVEFLKKLRSVRLFTDDVLLARAIARDVKMARAYFKKHPSF